MTIAWPAGLPAFVLEDDYAEAWADNVIRTPMDVGPPKVRRRSTAAPRRTGCSQLLTTAQVATLKTYYDTTTAYGSLSFEFTDPRTGSTLEARFLSPPAIRPAAPGYWRAAYSLEILP
jgi:hypothetical protein